MNIVRMTSINTLQGPKWRFLRGEIFTTKHISEHYSGDGGGGSGRLRVATLPYSLEKVPWIILYSQVFQIVSQEFQTYKTGTASVLMPQYDDWYKKNIFNEWFAFALSDRFDREGFFTCFLSKWQYWRDAYRFCG